MKKLLSKKQSGVSDFIVSIITIFALSIFVLFFIGSFGDVLTRIQIDQVARKYILRIESSGELTSAEVTSIKEELTQINSVKKATDAGNKITVSWNKGTTYDGGSVGYGTPVKLVINCPAVVTTFSMPESAKYITDYPIIGKKVQTFVVAKESTAKY